MHGKHKHRKSEVAITTHDTGAPNRWLLPVLLVAQLMVILDITAVNIALPHIATDLNLSGWSISWAITGYSLIFGSLLLFGGRAADLLGRRRLFLAGLVIFASSSFISALATSSPTLLSAPAGWTSFQTHLCGLGGVAGLIAFAVYERHTDRPLLRVGRMADRAVGGGLALQLVAAGSIFGLFLLCSLYLQNVLGWGPLNTGLAFIPLALAAGVGAPLSGHAISKHGVRVPLAGAFAIAAIGMFLLSRVGPSGSYVADILPGMLIAGLGLGVAVVTVSMSVLAGARSDEAGMIS